MEDGWHLLLWLAYAKLWKTREQTLLASKIMQDIQTCFNFCSRGSCSSTGTFSHAQDRVLGLRFGPWQSNNWVDSVTPAFPDLACFWKSSPGIAFIVFMAERTRHFLGTQLGCASHHLQSSGSACIPAKAKPGLQASVGPQPMSLKDSVIAVACFNWSRKWIMCGHSKPSLRSLSSCDLAPFLFTREFRIIIELLCLLVKDLLFCSHKNLHRHFCRCIRLDEPTKASSNIASSKSTTIKLCCLPALNKQHWKLNGRQSVGRWAHNAYTKTSVRLAIQTAHNLAHTATCSRRKVVLLEAGKLREVQGVDMCRWIKSMFAYLQHAELASLRWTHWSISSSLSANIHPSQAKLFRSQAKDILGQGWSRGDSAER